MKRTLLLISVGIVVAALTVGAIACSDDDDDNGSGATATTASSTNTTPTESSQGQTPSSGTATVKATENPTLGTILTTVDGFTVYTFDSDTGGASSCNEGCQDIWPPLPAAGEPTAGEGATGTVDTITRQDGTMQVTYDGKPLYMYSGDAAAGDTNGDGISGVWHVVKIQ
jgi:predicted lipoprotein with Yx(FWY)xxD motif